MSKKFSLTLACKQDVSARDQDRDIQNQVSRVQTVSRPRRRDRDFIPV